MKDRYGFDWSKIKGTHFWRLPQLSRRLFFHHIGAAVGGYFLLPSRPMETVAKAGVRPMGTAKNCIFVLMQGAPSHTDTFDLKEGAWTPAFMAPASYGDLRFPQGLMPKIAEQMDSIALVRSIRSWALVHQLSQTWMQIGRNPTSGVSKIAPHIGSVVARELAPSNKVQILPPFVSLNTGGGPGAGYYKTQYAPFYISPGGGGLGNASHPDGQPVFDRRYNLLNDLDAELRSSPDVIGASPAEMAQWNLSARNLMYNSQVNAAFTFDQNEKNRYGNTGFGNACITARNLVKAQLGARFIQITFGNWDHHTSIYQPNAQLSTMAKTFDQGLGTLIADLKQGGLLDETLIVAMGEFGRTVGPPNGSGGRDHYLQQAALFAGGRIKGQSTVGVTDKTGSATADPGWSRQRDIRPEDVEATIYSALGIDWTTVLHDDPLNRGFEYVPFAATDDLYGPIHELWG